MSSASGIAGVIPVLGDAAELDTLLAQKELPPYSQPPDLSSTGRIFMNASTAWI
jgi:hypothetical protein